MRVESLVQKQPDGRESGVVDEQSNFQITGLSDNALNRIRLGEVQRERTDLY
jgi:hypothetical protein